MEMGALTVGSRSPSGNSTGNSERAASPPAAANHDHPDSDREGKHPRRRPATDKCFSPIFIQVFTMNFLAEWGDRSQIATIALAAAQDPVGVTVGLRGVARCVAYRTFGPRLTALRAGGRHLGPLANDGPRRAGRQAARHAHLGEDSELCGRCALSLLRPAQHLHQLPVTERGRLREAESERKGG